MGDYMYHLTDKKHLEEILKNGLIPQIGEQATLCEEEIPYVYLTNERSVPYWRILINKPIIIQLDISKISNFEKYVYTNYLEYLTEEKISADAIIGWEELPIDKEIMRKLCIEHIRSISHACSAFALYYHKKLRIPEEDMIRETNILLYKLKHLDYSIIPQNEIFQIIKEYGDGGAFTFSNLYKGTEERLWSQLDKYPLDNMVEQRKALKNWITDTFDSSILTINTGDWPVC